MRHMRLCLSFLITSIPFSLGVCSCLDLCQGRAAMSLSCILLQWGLWSLE